MRVLVIGLGSMGKRRIRNLKAIGIRHIAGFDIRNDRLVDANNKYGISTFSSFEDAISKFQPDAAVISTSPQFHMDYAYPLTEARIPHFIEASVVDETKIYELAARITSEKLVVAPSCTMSYFPGPKLVSELIAKNIIGKVLSFTHHVGQWLPDWHPWEDISEFYVSNRSTGGAREIVPFELTWLNKIFGTPKVLSASVKKLSKLEADIDDYYNFTLEYSDEILANITIDVLSRPKATRELRIIGSEGVIEMSGDEGLVRYCNLDNPDWTVVSLARGTVQDGYIYPEEPYIQELMAFLSAVEHSNPKEFPNTLEEDYQILRLLIDIEQKSGNQ